MFEVWKALGYLNEVEEAALAEAAKYQKAVDNENKANVALIIILVLLVLLTVGGVVFCKVQKKLCFKEEEEVATEGGATDKALFKKEVKNKKKNAKESLMPSFQVADEQA